MNHQSNQKRFSGPPPQVIVILKEDVGPVIPKMRSITSMDSGAPEAKLHQTLSTNGLELMPVFGETETDVASFVARAEKAAGPANLSRMGSFYIVQTTPDTNLDSVVAGLNQLDIVEGAYVKPIGEPPVYYEGDTPPGSRADSGESVPIATNLTNHQTYLDAAPVGIDARYAWTLSGG